MPEENRNIYQTARRAAGLTQEAAAERLAVSVESLRAYENDYRVVPNDVVSRMVEIYDKQYLAYQHLRQTTDLMARVVPELDQRSLLELGARITTRINRLARTGGADRLLEIAEDGRIDEAERPDFEALAADLREIIRAGLELDILCREERSDG